jgi:hypothetical protein
MQMNQPDITANVTATINPNEVSARHTYREGFGHYLNIEVPNGWDDVKKLTKKVLRHDERKYTFRGWNSDRNECYFHSDGSEITVIL